MIEAYRELLALPLGEYDVAHLAYLIERVDVGQAGGRQDQYAATFGGINFIEFSADQAIVNPLRIRQSTLMELEAMLVLYLTGISRESAKIITEQSESLRDGREASLQAMHQIKRDAYVMKDALLHNDLLRVQRHAGPELGSQEAHRVQHHQCRDQPDLRACAVGRRVVGQGLGRRRRRVPVLHGPAGTTAAPAGGPGARAGHHHALRLHRGRRPGVACLIAAAGRIHAARSFPRTPEPRGKLIAFAALNPSYGALATALVHALGRVERSDQTSSIPCSCRCSSGAVRASSCCAGAPAPCPEDGLGIQNGLPLAHSSSGRTSTCSDCVCSVPQAATPTRISNQAIRRITGDPSIRPNTF